MVSKGVIFLRVQIISSTNALEAEYQIQQAIDAASERGEVLKEIYYSTAPAIIAAESRTIGDNPDDRAACWHNALLMFGQ